MEPYYQDDLVTLYHADAHTTDTWLDADVLVTDPPYGISYTPDAIHHDPHRRHTATPTIHGDHDTTTRDQALARWGPRPAVVFGTWRRPRPTATTHRLIWHKLGRHPGISPHPVTPVDEEIYLLGAGPWHGRTPTVITTHEQRSAEPRRWGHPTPKPVALMEILIQLTPPGAVITDPFAGSGATLAAARALGRRAIGVEIDEAYCETAARRLAQHTLPLC